MCSCRVSGSGVCLGIAAYTYSIYRKTPLTKVGDRRFSLIMSLGFAALGIYRALLYLTPSSNKQYTVYQ